MTMPLFLLSLSCARRILYTFYVWGYLLSIKPFLKVIYGMAIFYSHITETGSAKSREISSAIQSLAYVSCKRAYISAFSAHHPYSCLLEFIVKVKKLYLINPDLLCLKLNLLILSCKLVSSLSVHVTGRKDRWHLHYVANKLL